MAKQNAKKLKKTRRLQFNFLFRTFFFILMLCGVFAYKWLKGWLEDGDIVQIFPRVLQPGDGDWIMSPELNRQALDLQDAGAEKPEL